MERVFNQGGSLLAWNRRSFWFQEKVAEEVFTEKEF